jgi:hypothetical protein
MPHTRVTVAFLFFNLAMQEGHNVKDALASVTKDFGLNDKEQGTVAFLALVEILKSEESAILVIPS